MNQNFKDRLAEALSITKTDQKILDAGSTHPGDCRCEICRQWWKLMGPDGDDYGPFTKEEVERP